MECILDTLGIVKDYKIKELKKNLESSMITGYYPLEETSFIESLHIFFRNRDISLGSNFLDMGSGLGIKPAIACKLGLNAYGIEINRSLSESSQGLIMRLRKGECLPIELKCNIITGSYFPEDYVELRNRGESIAKEIEEKERLNKIDGMNNDPFFPYGNCGDIYEQLGIKLEEIDLFYRYGWKSDVPSVWEIFSRYGKQNSVLLHFSANFPVNSRELLEKLNLQSSSGDNIPNIGTIIRKK